jgi:hypothetical protein
MAGSLAEIHSSPWEAAPAAECVQGLDTTKTACFNKDCLLPICPANANGLELFSPLGACPNWRMVDKADFLNEALSLCVETQGG